MIPLRRILCPTDFSAYSRRALDLGLGLAQQFGSELLALHVARSGEPAAIRLARFLGPARERGIAAEGTCVEGGDVVAHILGMARDYRADLLVMGTHGQRERLDWNLGSVTAAVLRQSPCPVLIVARPTDGPWPAASFRRILCPSDFSETSQQALLWALSIARRARSRLTQLHVLEWFPEGGDREALCVPEYGLDLSQSARERLRLSVPRDARAWCECDEVVAGGQPHREILRVAHEKGIDLIVLGVHAMRALDHFLAGATLCHVAREAHCPVLAVRVVPAPEKVLDRRAEAR